MQKIWYHIYPLLVIVAAYWFASLIVLNFWPTLNIASAEESAIIAKVVSIITLVISFFGILGFAHAEDVRHRSAYVLLGVLPYIITTMLPGQFNAGIASTELMFGMQAFGLLLAQLVTGKPHWWLGYKLAPGTFGFTVAVVAGCCCCAYLIDGVARALLLDWFTQVPVRVSPVLSLLGSVSGTLLFGYLSFGRINPTSAAFNRLLVLSMGLTYLSTLLPGEYNAAGAYLTLAFSLRGIFRDQIEHVRVQLRLPSAYAPQKETVNPAAVPA